MERDEPTLDDIDDMTARQATGLAGLRDPEAALDCLCACHTRRFGQPTGDLHDEGADCPCQYSPEENRRRRTRWLDEWHESEEGKALAAAARRERDEVERLAAELGGRAEMTSWAAPMIVEGEMHGRGFWFRERHGMWRLHIDGYEGEVIASGAGELRGADVVRLASDELDRAIRREGCRHPMADPQAMFCSRCGDRLAPVRPTDDSV